MSIITISFFCVFILSSNLHNFLDLVATFCLPDTLYHSICPSQIKKIADAYRNLTEEQRQQYHNDVNMEKDKPKMESQSKSTCKKMKKKGTDGKGNKRASSMNPSSLLSPQQTVPGVVTNNKSELDLAREGAVTDEAM